MKFKGIYLLLIIFYFTICTTYFWETETEEYSILVSLLLVLVFFILFIILLQQLNRSYFEKFKYKQRTILVLFLTSILALTYYKPLGIINFDAMHGKTLLYAKREGVASSGTIFKLREDKTFTLRTVYFGLEQTSGKYRISSDTIHFENIVYPRNINKKYIFAIIKKEKIDRSYGSFDLIFY
jgi:hypothetical protein